MSVKRSSALCLKHPFCCTPPNMLEKKIRPASQLDTSLSSFFLTKTARFHFLPGLAHPREYTITCISVMSSLKHGTFENYDLTYGRFLTKLVEERPLFHSIYSLFLQKTTQSPNLKPNSKRLKYSKILWNKRKANIPSSVRR